MAEEDGILVVAAPYGSDVYRLALALREAILRRPLGLTLTEEEQADDALRQHFCATSQGLVLGSVSLKPLDGGSLRLRQMAVAEDRRGERISARLLARAEDWARGEGYRLMVLNARLGAEGFHAKFGYAAQGEPFNENTIPHISMTKHLGQGQAGTSGGRR